MLKQTLLMMLIAFGFNLNLKAQADSISRADIVDIVWLRNGSKLSGTILKWDLARGMEFQLLTGAKVEIPKNEIAKVTVDAGFQQGLSSSMSYGRERRPYAFKEHGLYQSFSLFLNFSDPGGSGLQYTIGHRFSRLLGVGGGIGVESNDFFNDRGIVPLFVEARGYFRPAKGSPYYAMKIGYGYAIKHENVGELEAKGGVYFSPELGYRFGGRAVNYYMGLEYKIQKATYVNAFPWEGTTTDKITYRRVDLRVGLVF